MSQYAVHVDCFTSLDDLKKKHHGNPDAVLAFLQEHRITRVSAWDMTPALGRSFDALKRDGTLRTDVEEMGFPWIAVHVTPESESNHVL